MYMLTCSDSHYHTTLNWFHMIMLDLQSKDGKSLILTEQSEHAERRCISFKVHIENKRKQKQNRWHPPQEVHSLLTELGLQCSAAGHKHHWG